MTRLHLVLTLSVVATGCTMSDDEGPIDAPGLADCACPHDTMPVDAPDPCAQCGTGTMCVQLFGGTCTTLSVTCEPIVAGCEQLTCSTACDQAYCDPGGVSTCMAAGCADGIPGAFHCYGV